MINKFSDFYFLKWCLPFCVCVLISDSKCFSQNIGINSTGASGNSSSGLDVDFTNKGLLIPRVSLSSSTDVSTISSPANYLTVYNTNTTMTNGNGAGMYYYDGTKWVYIDAPSNGPGSNGQVITSLGSGSQPQWTTLSSSNCSLSDWILVAVGNSTQAQNGGYYSTGYTLTPNKEVMLVLESFLFTDVTLATSDAVTILQSKNSAGTTSTYWAAPTIGAPGGPMPANNGGPGDYVDCVEITGKRNSTSNVKYSLISLSDGVFSGLSVDGTGLVWMYDPNNSHDVGVYIFER